MKKYICFVFLLPAMMACHRNPLIINVSSIELTLKVERLDQELFNVTAKNADQILPRLEKKFDPFFAIYNKEILAIGDSRDSLYTGYLLSFLNDSNVTHARLKSDSLFRNFRPYSEQLELAFKHFRYYFPGLPVPTVYTYLSGYNQSIVTMPYSLGISLDNYLGSACPYYTQLGIFEYKRHNMEPRKIVYDALYGWASQQFEYKGKTENLVSAMIFQGKLLYFLDAMIPDGQDSLKIGYKQTQLDWCKEHEQQMWSYLVENKMLFSGDRMELVRFINPAPFTTPFGQKSPGRTGIWLGWQIVKNYQKNHPALTLQELMAENDYHKILNESGYSPDS